MTAQAVKSSTVLLGLARITSRGSPSLDELLRRVARYFMAVFRADVVSIFLYDKDAKSVVPAAVAYRSKNPPASFEKIALRITPQSVFWQCFHMQRPGVMRLAGNSVAARDIIDLSWLSRIIMVPMRSDDGVVGVMVLGLETPAQEWLAREEEPLLVAAADQAAVVIAKARIFQELAVSEAKYRTMTENVLDMVFSLDRLGRFTFLNSRVNEILGYAPEELIGRYFSEILTQESWQSTLETLELCKKSGRTTAEYEWQAVTKDGRIVALDVRAALSFVEMQFCGQYGIARDITEKRAMEREVLVSKKKITEMKDYLALVTRIQEEERRRIARELHDDTAQALVALSRRLELCKASVSDSPTLQRRLRELESLLCQTIDNLRSFIRSLRPPVLDDLGLGPALEWLADEASRTFGLAVRVDVQYPRRLPQGVEATLFRIAQEALNNAGRHARAKNVTLQLATGAEEVILLVEDDGEGFNWPCSTGELQRRGKLGISSMIERAEIAGGRLEIRSKVGEGTRVTAVIPLLREEAGPW
ncbi:MAG: PAS domain S-box protein [Bacillota bacterium]